MCVVFNPLCVCVVFNPLCVCVCVVFNPLCVCVVFYPFSLCGLSELCGDVENLELGDTVEYTLSKGKGNKVSAEKVNKVAAGEPPPLLDPGLPSLTTGQ